MDRYLSEEVFSEVIGNGYGDDADGLRRRGVNASSGPLEGVEAVRFPEGVAVKNVPLYRN